MSEIVSWSACETVSRIRARAVSVEEVTQAHLDRIEAVNPGLNAVVELVPEALEVAREIDARKRPMGLLAGVPVTTKVNADQAGLANSNGLSGLRDNICAEDSAVVANLRNAGAVIIGRTNTPEMSLRWCTSNPLYGVTKNPWDAKATPGGSSGGAAAAVASGIGGIAHGNDLGGSVRYPAYCCGITGLRPSRGRIPAFNPSAASDRPEMTMAMSVQGPLARCVSDVQLGLDAMRGYHPGDPNWSSAPRSGRVREAGPLRFAALPSPFATPADAAVQSGVARAARAAQSAGMAQRQVTLPEPERCAEVWGQLLFTETKSMYEDFVGEQASPELQGWLDAFMSEFECLDLDGYIRTMADRARLQRLWAGLWEEVDFLILPGSLIPPFENDLDFTERSAAPRLIDALKPQYVVNLIGLPALALPTHVEAGRPIGVQLVGPMHDDDAVLAAGKMIESALGGGILAQLPAPYAM